MPNFSLAHLWRERGGAIAILTALILLLGLFPILLLTRPSLKPTPQHGIHAPIGNQWTDLARQALNSFRDTNGTKGAPGLVVALSSDMGAANNSAKSRLEQDLNYYATQGSQIFIRLFPQRFPGGLSEPLIAGEYRNTISGTADDVANDIFNFVDAQQKRNGWHFSLIIPGNEPDIEWPNQSYNQNLLSWVNNGDPAKYAMINRFYSAVYKAWQLRQNQADAKLYQDVKLYFPALAQDATPGAVSYAAFNYYGANGQAVGNRYDNLRPAIELYKRISWHNYFQPGRACADIAAQNFPTWLKQGLQNGWAGVISEAGWAPHVLILPSQTDSRAILVKFWQLLGIRWEKGWYTDDRLQSLSYDDVIAGQKFEADLQAFTGGCHVAGLNLKQTIGIAIWLAGSDGNFEPMLGVTAGKIRRWLQVYANQL